MGKNYGSIGDILIGIGADVATLKADMAKASGVMSGAAKNLQGIGNQISKSLTAAFTVGGILAFTKAVSALAAKGDELSDVTNAFERLGGTSAMIQQATEATKGMVTQLDLMKAANAGLLKGLPDLEKNFGSIVDLAARTAEGMGTDIPTNINKLIAALAAGKKNALETFGVFITKGEETESIMQKVVEAVDKLPPVGDGAAASFQQLAVAIEDATAQIGLAVDQSSYLESALDAASTVVKNFALAWEDFFDTTSRAKFQALQEDIAETRDNIEAFKTSLKPLPLLMRNIFPSANNSFIKDAQDQLAALEKQAAEFGKKGNAPKIGPTPEELRAARAAEQAAKAAAKEGAKAAEKQRKEFEDATKASADFFNKIGESTLNDKLKLSISTGNVEDFKRLAKSFEEYSVQAFDVALEDFKAKGVKIAPEIAAAYREQYINQVNAPVLEDWKQKWGEVADTSGQQLGEAFNKALDGLESFFSGLDQTLGGIENVFGVKIPEGLSRGLEIAQGIFDIINGISSTIDSISNITSAVSSIIGLVSGNPGAASIGGGGGSGALGGALGGAAQGAAIGSVIPGVGTVAGGVIGGIGGALGLFAKGGIVNGASPFMANGKMNIMGEAGPEAIMPLTRVGGELGVKAVGGAGGGHTINIDARGAASGVSEEIERVLRSCIPDIVSITAQQIYDDGRRAGYYGNS